MESETVDREATMNVLIDCHHDTLTHYLKRLFDRIGCKMYVLGYDLKEDDIGDYEIDVVVSTCPKYSEDMYNLAGRVASRPVKLLLGLWNLHQYTYVRWDHWDAFVTGDSYICSVLCPLPRDRKSVIMLEPSPKHRDYYPIPEEVSIYSMIRMPANRLAHDRDSFIIREWSNVRKCPHCQTENPPFLDVNELDLWNQCVDTIDARFDAYGMDCGQKSYAGMLTYEESFKAHIEHDLMFHFKHAEGYGLAITEALASGRMIISDWRWWRYRAAGEWFREGVNFIHSDSDVSSIKEAIDWWAGLSYDERLMRSQESHRRFWRSVNFQYEAERVKKLIELGRGQ